jgi:hypothetical protein
MELAGLAARLGFNSLGMTDSTGDATTDGCDSVASGGHNAGIISEPRHAKRSYQMSTRRAQGPCP